MDYKYTELDYAKEIYEKGFQSEQHMPTELRLVATYMRRILGYKPKELREKMYEWCEKNIIGYKKELYYKKINSAINSACKKNSMLINVNGVDFYQYELDYINNLYIMSDVDDNFESEYSYECKKLLFTLLFKMKVNKYITEAKTSDDEFEYKGKYFQGGQKKYTELKKLAKLPEKVRINEDIINTLWVNGLVYPMFNGLVKLNFMEEIYEIENKLKKKYPNKNDWDDNNPPVLKVEEYDCVGWYFDLYNNCNKVASCDKCGKLFKKKSNVQRYCSDECSKEINKEKSKKRMQILRNS